MDFLLVLLIHQHRELNKVIDFINSSLHSITYKILTFTVKPNIIEMTMAYIITKITPTLIKGVLGSTAVKRVDNRTRTLAIVG